MAIIKMHKITIIGMEKEKPEIIDNLMDIGVLDISDISEKVQVEEWAGLVENDGNEEEILQLGADIEKIKTSLEYLKQYDKRKKPLFSSKRTIDALNYNKIIGNKGELWASVEKINKMDDELTQLKLEQNKLDSLIASLNPWKSMNVPVELTNTKTSTIMTGVIPLSNDVDGLIELLNKEVPESFIQIINEDKEQLPCYYLPQIKRGRNVEYS